MKKTIPSKSSTLSQKVVEKTKNHPSKTSSLSTESDLLKLSHIREVNQIELEMQSLELRLKDAQLDDTLKLFKALYDFAPVGYLSLSKEGEISKLNLLGSRMLGKERLHLLGSRFGFFVSDDTKPIFTLFFEKVLTSKTKEWCEVKLLDNSSSPKQVLMSGIASENGEGCLLALVDITELHELTYQNKEKQKRADELAIAIKELAYQNGEKQKRADELAITNKERADELAIANKELTYQSEQKQKHADELAVANNELALAKEKVKHAKELTIANKNLMMIKNLLHEANENLENLIDHANSPIIVWNPQFHIIRFNHAFERLTGWTEAAVTGQSCKFLFPPESAETIMSQLRNIQEEKRGESVEINILHRDKSIRTLLWNPSTIFEKDGRKPISTIAMGQEITNQKQTEQRLRESELNLKERIKELNGLLSLSLLTEKFEKIEDVYIELINNIVPESMQFPENIFASLEIENKKYCNIENFKIQKNQRYLSAPIKLFEKPSGVLIVAYTEDIPFIDIFEQNLITQYALRISKITELYISRQLH